MKTPVGVIGGLLVCAGLLFGCQAGGMAVETEDAAMRQLTLSPEPVGTLAAGPDQVLTPYRSPSPFQTAAPQEAQAASVLPTATATPRSHTVNRGEDLGGIAYAYGITLQALRDANPEVDPFSMSVGTVLVIPPSENSGPDAGPDLAAVVTPVPVQFSPPACYPSAGGLWCFSTASNSNETAVESITARFRLVGADGIERTETAALPLDVLNPGQSLALAAFFGGPAPITYQAGIDALSALPLVDVSARYVPVEIQNLAIEIAEDGLSARLTGRVTVQGERAAARVWVAASAYDSRGQATGIRRWESSDSLQPGEGRDFTIVVYSVGGQIGVVEAAVEAGP
jgi:LysM repeat protein